MYQQYDHIVVLHVVCFLRLIDDFLFCVMINRTDCMICCYANEVTICSKTIWKTEYKKPFQMQADRPSTEMAFDLPGKRLKVKRTITQWRSQRGCASVRFLDVGMDHCGR